MKKIIVKMIMMALLVLPFGTAIQAGAVAPPNWNTTGNYVVAFNYLGTDYAHDMSLTQDTLGNLTGNGGSPAGGSHVYTWDITSGSVIGDTIDFLANYTATADAVTPLTVMHVTGTVASSGIMSGTWSDNYQGGTREGTWSATSGTATFLGSLAAEDFGVVNYNTGLGQLRGYTAGFGLTDATFAGVQSVVVKLYSGTSTLLQTNAATAKVGTDITGVQISSPFDVSGTFDYATDGYWTNVREVQFGQSVPATKVVATVTLANGKVVTAENNLLTGNPTTIYPATATSVDLLSAENFVVLSKTGITNTGSHSSVITGNIGSSPITANAMDSVFCSELTGTMYGVDAAYVGSGIQTCFAGNPPLSNKTLVDTAVADMETAYADAAGRINPTATELGAGNIGGMVIAPGLYKWSTDVTIPTNVTLSGGANDVWIFQIAGNLNIASGGSVPSGIKVLLAGGADPAHIFWQVGGPTGVTLGTYSTFNGTILSAKQIIIQTGAVLTGRALAQTQVVLDANKVSAEAQPTAPTTVKVTIMKFIDGIQATSQSAQNADFPMNATWNAENIGAGSGQYNLSASGFGGDPTPYYAITSDMTLGAQYSTNEITGGSVVGDTCSTGQPYALVGYSVGDTLLQAQQATTTMDVPSFINLSSNKFVLVRNITCPTTGSTTGSLTIEKNTIGKNGTFTFTSDISGNQNFSITTENNTGSQTFNNLAPGVYHVTEKSLKGWTMTDNECATVTVVAGADSTCIVTNTNNKFLGEIRGTKYEDVNGDGILKKSQDKKRVGWTIYLDTNDNGMLDNGEASVVTRNGGKYSFKNLPAGTYHVREVGQSGWVQTYPVAGVHHVVLVAGKIAKDKDFGNFHLGTISGMKFNDVNGNGRKDNGEVGLQGWTINLMIVGSPAIIASTTTDVNGNYSFTELGFGNYQVREVQQTGWVQTTSNPSNIKMLSGTVSKKDNFGNHFGPVRKDRDYDCDENRG